MKKTTGEKLRKLRGGKSIAETAEAIGIPASTLSMYERDERTPRDAVKVKIAKFYKVSVESLFFS
jgi:transcriptional regulator with XRE-family HTH domain